RPALGRGGRALQRQRAVVVGDAGIGGARHRRTAAAILDRPVDGADRNMDWRQNRNQRGRGARGCIRPRRGGPDARRANARRRRPHVFGLRALPTAAQGRQPAVSLHAPEKLTTTRPDGPDVWTVWTSWRRKEADEHHLTRPPPSGPEPGS